MTLKEREDRFIDQLKGDGHPMTFESEILLRYGFGAGARELKEAAFEAGVEHQRGTVLASLGAVPARRREGEP